jgi:hypothetical protein
VIIFFRKIRKRLAAENKQIQYLRYAIGEIILVVIGILIALQIHNWNEDKKLRRIEQQYLQALKEEFTFNKGELERVMNRNQLNFESAVKILDNTGPRNPEITDETLGKLLMGSLSQETQFDPSQGVLDEIISSGKLVIFSSNELKFALSSWSGHIYRVRLQEQELLDMRSRTIELVRNNTNLRKTLDTVLEGMGISKTKFEQGNLHLLNSIPFDGHMTGFATMCLNLNTYHYPKLVDEIDNILELIEDNMVEN